MARVACSMSGDGRGHATRVLAVVENVQLRPSHPLTLDLRPRELRARCHQLTPNGNAPAFASVLQNLPPCTVPARRRVMARAPVPLRPATLGGHP